jgi:hypothetical protein
MTRSSIQEYTEAVRCRYLQPAKKEKGEILNEFTKVTGYHRKAAIRILRRRKQWLLSCYGIWGWEAHPLVDELD